MNRNATRERYKPFRGPPQQKKRTLRPTADGAARIKLLLQECLREYPKPIGLGGRC